MISKISLVFLISSYALVSFLVFNKVYKTTKTVIDEEFHLRQGIHYCHGNLRIWDPKITTFPGLYILSGLFLFPWQACDVYYMRLISLIASMLNVYFIFQIRHMILHLNRNKLNFQIIVETLSIALLPPMYFFAHLYYTDIVAICAVLGMIMFSLQNKHTMGTVFGMLSVLMRQTNIVWVAMIVGYNVMDFLVAATSKKISGKNKIPHHYGYQDFFTVLKYNLKHRNFMATNISNCMPLYGYLYILFGFVLFLAINGSIVLGDKSQHEAVLHLPQLFYFSLFVAFFGHILILPNIRTILQIIKQKLLAFTLAMILCAVIINSNTLVHSYLLADNRHYTFYLWSRFYGKYEFAKYLMIPVYLIGLISVWLNLRKKSFGFLFCFTVCLFTAVGLQKLLEIRYFLIPYLIIRLNMRNVKLKYCLVELIVNIALNIFTFYTFFNKEIVWSDYKEIQRMIW